MANIKTKRLFAALLLPADTKQKINTALGAAKAGDTGLGWVKESMLHITLEFFGDTDAAREKVIRDILQKFAKQHSRAEFATAGISAFPNESAPRVLVLLLQPASQGLHRWQHKIRTELIQNGVSLSRQPWRPHIAIGRTRAGRKVDLHKLKQLIPLELTSRISRYALIESRLRAGGAEHKILNTYEL